MEKKNILFRSLTTGVLIFMAALLLTACSGGSSGEDGGDTQAPSIPANLQGNPVSSTQIDLTWNPSTDNVGVTGYKIRRDGVEIATKAIKGRSVGLMMHSDDLIERFKHIENLEQIGEDEGFIFGVMSGDKSVTTTHYSDTGLTPGTTYLYCVCACDAAGNESEYCVPIKVTTRENGVPPTPTGLTAAAVSANRINLNWYVSTGGVGVAGYKVFRNGSEIASNVTTTSYSDMNLLPDTQYCYRVSAFDAQGNESGLSDQACATTFNGDNCGEGLPLDFSDLDFPNTVQAGTVVEGSVAYSGSFEDIANPVMCTLYPGEVEGEIYVAVQFETSPTATDDCRIEFVAYMLTNITGSGYIYFGLYDWDNSEDVEYNINNNLVSNMVEAEVTITDGNGNCGEGLPLEIGDLIFPNTVQASSFVPGSVAYWGSFEDIANPVLLTWCFELVGDEYQLRWITRAVDEPPVATDNCRIEFVAAIDPEPTGTVVLAFALWDWDNEADNDYNIINNQVSNEIDVEVTITP